MTAQWRAGYIVVGVRAPNALQAANLPEREAGVVDTAASQSEEPAPAAELQHFYQLLEDLESRLGGTRPLGDCHAGMNWPARGVYFLFEPGELRGSGMGRSRVTHVGTHGIRRASRATLWSRLRSHRGTRAGSGDHRRSLLRLHVGLALMRRSYASRETIHLPTWGKGKHAPRAVREMEREHEMRASNYLGAMQVLWLPVDDEPGPSSDRAVIERNAVALLAEKGSRVDPPSSDWLGHHSRHLDIKTSGLWNLRPARDACDPTFLELMERYLVRL